jgi:hypothetical protein
MKERRGPAGEVLQQTLQLGLEIVVVAAREVGVG